MTDKHTPVLRVTKRRGGDGRFGPIWCVYIDGAPTNLTVTRSTPPKYGSIQEWDVLNGTDDDLDLVFSSKSLEGALATIWLIAANCRAAIAQVTAEEA